MRKYKHVKAALWLAAMFAFLGIFPMIPKMRETAYAVSFSEELLEKAFEEEFGNPQDFDTVQEDYENEDLHELTQQYLELFQDKDFLVETFNEDVIEKPKLEMQMMDNDKIRYYLPNGEFYNVTVPNGAITSNPVKIEPSSQVAAIVTKDGESSSIFNSWTYTEPGTYQVKMLFYSIGSDNYEKVQVYEVHHYFTIIGNTVNQIGAVSAPEGFEIISVKKDNVKQTFSNPKIHFLEGDGIFEIRYRDIETGTIYSQTTFERDTIAPFLEFSTDIFDGPVKGPVEFYIADPEDKVYIAYNGNSALARSNHLSSAGKYSLKVVDQVGNSRMYSLEIRQTYRIFETKTIILALIFLLVVGAQAYLLRKDIKVI